MVKIVRLIGILIILAITAPPLAVWAGVDDDINEIVGRQNRIYFDNQPIPLYDYSAQRDLVIQLYNITVPNLPNTWTVMYEMGIATDVCTSKGYPIPFGVSLTSPEYMKDSHETSESLPQPEPTGLYNQGVTTTASWVMCVNPVNGLVEPVYLEGTARTYPHPVTIDENNRLVHDYDGTTVWMDITRAGQ